MSVVGTPRESGFTLLELLVVLVIIALGAGLGVSWLQGGSDQRLQSFSQQWADELRMAASHALGQRQLVAMIGNDQGYRFVTWQHPRGDAEGRWAPLSTPLLTEKTWPTGLAVSPQTPSEAGGPWLAWWPDGEVLATRLDMRLSGSRIVLAVDGRGVRLEPPGEVVDE